MSTATDTTTATVETLTEGQMVDLQDDTIADPAGDGNYDFAYAQVLHVHQFTADGVQVINVEFMHDEGEVSINFPLGHQVILSE